ncbi:MAG TPA: CAP domain-containing protein [Pseudolabrys sp.]
MILALNAESLGDAMHGCRTFIAFVIFLCICPSALADSLNSFRRAHGLSALHRSAGLQAMAQRHARSMAARQSMDHDGFYSERGPKGARAENVAWGCANESCAMRMWENSSGHRANMLLSDVKSYGLASAAGGRTRYWCLVLGR